MGNKVEKDAAKYHSKRRIFAIINGELKLEDEGYLKSHNEWFLEKGWIKLKEDPLFEKITRGMLDPAGNLYFYVGKKLELTENSEKEFFEHLKEIVQRLDIRKDTKIYGGMVMGEIGTQWPPRKDFGKVKDFI